MEANQENTDPLEAIQWPPSPTTWDFSSCYLPIGDDGEFLTMEHIDCTIPGLSLPEEVTASFGVPDEQAAPFGGFPFDLGPFDTQLSPDSMLEPNQLFLAFTASISSNDMTRTPSSWGSPLDGSPVYSGLGYYPSVPGVLSQQQPGGPYPYVSPPVEQPQPFPSTVDAVGACEAMINTNVKSARELSPKEPIPGGQSLTEGRVFPREKMRDKRKILLPAQCKICDKGHDYKSSLDKHILSKHPDRAWEFGLREKIYPCKEEGCQCSYSRSDRLYRHGVRKHGWTPRKRREAVGARSKRPKRSRG